MSFVDADCFWSSDKPLSTSNRRRKCLTTADWGPLHWETFRRLPGDPMPYADCGQGDISLHAGVPAPSGKLMARRGRNSSRTYAIRRRAPSSVKFHGDCRMTSGKLNSSGIPTNHLTKPTPLRDSLFSSVTASRRIDVQALADAQTGLAQLGEAVSQRLVLRSQLVGWLQLPTLAGRRATPSRLVTQPARCSNRIRKGHRSRRHRSYRVE